MITIYRSTDASAPVLSGQAASLTALLKACLVDGYGAKAAAGWTNPLNGAAGQRIFRPGSGVQHYFEVDDSAGGTGGAKEALFSGFEAMSAWATGTGQFPTAAQISTGLVARKSNTADATARPWIVAADARTCYVFVSSGDAAATYLAFAFGEMFSLLNVADSYRSIVVGRVVANSASAANDKLDVVSTGTLGGSAGHYMPRSYTGLGSSVQVGKWGNPALLGGTAVIGSQGLAVPEPCTGAIVVTPVKVSEVVTASALRGRLRGFFQLCHPSTLFADGDTITGVSGYAGRTFLIIKSSGGGGAYCIDATGPWETN